MDNSGAPPGVALIIGRSNFKLAVFFRTFFFMPYVLSEVITGILWHQGESDSNAAFRTLIAADRIALDLR